MPEPGRGVNPTLGYEFAQESEAQHHAAELDRRFTKEELLGLRVYRIRWNGNYLVEATFTEGMADARVNDARALLGESGVAVHPDDLTDYKRATGDDPGGLPDWLRRFFGGA